jgi:hypothetical protein
MMPAIRSRRSRKLRPGLVSLEDRALLNAAMPNPVHQMGVSAQIHVESTKNHPLPGPTITVLGRTHNGGFTFTNFDGPMAGTNANAGTNMNGISNDGTAVGFDIDNAGNLHNFTVKPLKSPSVKVLNINGAMNAMALGVNKDGVVVGTDGNNNAFFLANGVVKTFIPPGGTSATAFGINDHNVIVGQDVVGNQTPGFIRVNNHTFIRIDAPSGPNVVNAQSINSKGLVVGFYEGTDGQVHGFMANQNAAKHGTLTGTAIADPTIPVVAGEPGATFVFSQILGINDQGIAVGYYGDSTTSQHGFIYNTKTGHYTFLDDPAEAFHNGVEVTQITGINNQNEITGFYSDANGVSHGFVGTPLRI